jgi:hypothetical protein
MKMKILQKSFVFWSRVRDGVIVWRQWVLFANSSGAGTRECAFCVASGIQDQTSRSRSQGSSWISRRYYKKKVTIVGRF